MMRDNTVLRVGRILTPENELRDGSIYIKNGKIDRIDTDNNDNQYIDTIISFPHGIAVPGFVDLHIHGYGGNSMNTKKEAEILEIARTISKHGVTTVFPTTMSDTRAQLQDACRAFTEASGQAHQGAILEGLHLEGPHINENQRGAQDATVLRDPEIKELMEYIEASNQNIERVTLAPELPGAIEYIEHAKERDIALSAGHTSASYEEGNKSFDAGITSITHLYNRTGKFHHRKPGIVGAGLTRDDVNAELIADLIHLHPAAIEIALRAKGVDNLLLVTDAIAATGLPDGEYELNGQPVIVGDGTCRLKQRGNLAGSTLTMDQAVRNMVETVGIPLEDAVKMASTNPANAQGLPDRGRIEEGYRADITILDDELSIIATIVGGDIIYRREGDVPHQKRNTDSDQG